MQKETSRNPVARSRQLSNLSVMRPVRLYEGKEQGNAGRLNGRDGHKA
jgi:hypothetical protein